MKYRPDIDGLRAIAVLSVLTFHYGAPLPKTYRLPGGFTGVDVFFVISGFLITSNLTSDIRSGKFSILSFYNRRIRRIFPALIVVLAATLLAGHFILMPGDYVTLASSSAAAAFGLSNFYFLSNTGYFDQAADLMPLLHTWSLAVEEQFYLFWPPLLFLIVRFCSAQKIASIVGAVVAIGFGISLIWFGIAPKSAFYTVVPRAWELAIGALLVFVSPLSRLLLAETATIVGLATIGYGFLFASPTAFPGSAALYPCIGAALVIWPRTHLAVMSRILSWLAPLGLISYSLYLWHWPVWVFFRIYNNNETPTISEAIALVFASVTLAIVSYMLIEQPFRKRAIHPINTFGASIGACAGIFIVSMIVRSYDGMPNRLSESAFKMRNLEVMWDWPCAESRLSPSVPPLCTFGADSSKRALLWGDSNAEHLAPILAPIATELGYSVTLAGSCVAILDNSSVIYGERNLYNENCGLRNSAIWGALESDRSIQTVILSASWNYFILKIAGDQKQAIFKTAMRNLLQRLKLLNKRVFIITAIPHWSHTDPVSCAMNGLRLLRREHEECRITQQDYNRENAKTRIIFSELKAEFPFLQIIDARIQLCKSEVCVSSLNGELLYRDQVHFRRNLSKKTNQDLASMMDLSSIFR